MPPLITTMKKLLIDVGHSKRFPGAAGFKAEVAWVREIQAALLPMLDRTKWDVRLVPDSYWNDYSANSNLQHRINWINKAANSSAYLLSIHANWASSPHARGVETCYYGGSQDAWRAASNLTASYARATGAPVFGDGTSPDTASRFGRLGIIRDTTPFALLIECGFVSNQEDMQVSSDRAAKGIVSFFNFL